MMKKLLCALIALTILCTAALVPVSAETPKYERLLLLGDSITYGYGLEGDVNSCPSYGNLVRDELGLDSAHFKNAAVNGYTSEQLLALLPKIQSEIKASDLIIVTIGGNDLLHLVWSALDAVFEGGFRDFSQLPDVLADPAKMQKLLDQLTLTSITSAIVKYTTNMAAITSYLRTNAPETEIIFLAQYDPMEGVEGIDGLSAVSAAAINMLNAAMKSQAEISGCTYLDAYTPFRGHAKDWTNILAIDIHPNKEGHRQLYLLVMDYLNSKSVTPSDTTPAETTPTETTPETTPSETTPGETTPSETTPEVPTSTEPVTEPETTPIAPDGTTTPAADTSSAQLTDVEPKPGKSGCGSVVSLGLLAAALPLAVLVIKKKH